MVETQLCKLTVVVKRTSDSKELVQAVDKFVSYRYPSRGMDINPLGSFAGGYSVVGRA